MKFFIIILLLLSIQSLVNANFKNTKDMTNLCKIIQNSNFDFLHNECIDYTKETESYKETVKKLNNTKEREEKIAIFQIYAKKVRALESRMNYINSLIYSYIITYDKVKDKKNLKTIDTIFSHHGYFPSDNIIKKIIKSRIELSPTGNKKVYQYKKLKKQQQKKISSKKVDSKEDINKRLTDANKRIAQIQGSIPTSTKTNTFTYTIKEEEIQHKGGDVRKGLPPIYELLVLRLTLHGKSPTKLDIKNLLSKALWDAQKKYLINAISIYMYLESSDYPIGRVEWWPRGHSLSRSNYKNIQNIGTYATVYNIDAPKKLDNKLIVNRLSILKRQEIYMAIANSEKRAREEAKIKIPNPVLRRGYNSTDEYAQKLEKIYKQQIQKTYKIDDDEYSTIIFEGVSAKWPSKSIKNTNFTTSK